MSEETPVPDTADLSEMTTMPDPVGLSEILTQWTLIRTAHSSLEGVLDPEAADAMAKLISRYHNAVNKYLKLKLRDSNLADEVSQEFWSKLLAGKLSGADPAKGRFRDYLRTVLHRLIIDHFRGRKIQSLPPGDLLDPSSTDQEFDQAWRETMLERVWLRLQNFEATTPKNRYATVLTLRREHPEASIDQLATELGKKLNASVTPEAFRKTLQRARSKFLELLIQELRETIHPAGPEDIEAEIYDLGLGSLYRRYSEENAA